MFSCNLLYAYRTEAQTRGWVRSLSNTPRARVAMETETSAWPAARVVGCDFQWLWAFKLSEYGKWQRKKEENGRKLKDVNRGSCHAILQLISQHWRRFVLNGRKDRSLESYKNLNDRNLTILFMFRTDHKTTVGLSKNSFVSFFLCIFIF